ncbi:MAG: hypothetical protein ACPGVT_09455 [Maricaulaceae bacterium]
MTAPLRLSLNELSALIKSVFQGCFGHDQDWGEMAERVMWLEARGFGGLDMLMDVLGEDMTLRGFAGEITAAGDGKSCVIDLNGGSLLLGLHICSDIAVDMAARHGEAKVVIKNARHGSAVLAAVSTCAKFSYPVRALWHEGSAFCEFGAVAPTIYGSEYEGVEIHLGGVFEHKDASATLSGEAVQARYEDSLAHGIAVNTDVYAALNQVADRFLVEATEASRKGAGE